MKKLKYIISTMIFFVLFASVSLTAHADPLTSAMIAASSGMGFGWTTFSGMPAGTASTYVQDKLGFNQSSNWVDLDGSGVYIRVDEGTETDTVTIGPDITQAAYERINYLCNTYNLDPGTVHSYGNVLAVNGYYFITPHGNNQYAGPIIGNLDGTTNFAVDSSIYLNVTYTADTVPTNYSYQIGSRSGNGTLGASNKDGPVRLEIWYTSTFMWYVYNPITQQWNQIVGVNNTGLNTTQANLSVNRTNDSEVLDPDGENYMITIPHRSISDDLYQDGVNVYDKEILKDILDTLEKIATDGDVDDTVVLPPPGPINPDDPTDQPDIGGALGGIQDSLDDLIDTQTGIQEGVTDIVGAMDGITESVDSITEALEGVEENIGSITDALEVPTTSEATQLKLPDLRTLFPFCIPFDIYNIITAFNASPVAPRAQIPFNIPSIGLQYTFDIDLSSFNGVAQIVRTLEFVAYAVGLAILTSKVIRW